MARFYGWTPADIDSLDIDTADRYWRAITVIEAQDILLQLRIADWPYLKKNPRSSFHRQMHKLAYPDTASGSRVDPEQAARLMGLNVGK